MGTTIDPPTNLGGKIVLVTRETYHIWFSNSQKRPFKKIWTNRKTAGAILQSIQRDRRQIGRCKARFQRTIHKKHKRKTRVYCQLGRGASEIALVEHCVCTQGPRKTGNCIALSYCSKRNTRKLWLGLHRERDVKRIVLVVALIVSCDGAEFSLTQENSQHNEKSPKRLKTCMRLTT